MLTALTRITLTCAGCVGSHVGGRRPEKWWSATTVGSPNPMVRRPGNGAGGRHLVLYKLAGFCNDGINGRDGLLRLVACATGAHLRVAPRGRTRNRQLYLPGYPLLPSAALRPDTLVCETSRRLANPAKRTESIFKFLVIYYQPKYLIPVLIPT